MMRSLAFFHIVVSICILFILGCNQTSSSKVHSPTAPAGGETTIPFFIGAARADVHRGFGHPDLSGTHLTGGEFETFSKHGVAVEYALDDTVSEIIASWFHGGRFEGKILGISLGESKESYSATLGEPDTTKPTLSEYSLAIWQLDDCNLELEIWKDDGEIEPWGQFRKGDVKQ
ncbi:hypothetical protein N9Y42_10660, partial [Mariniblastus sp.]|nr:hypothetical protein [Mariniblastus sp.]